MLDLFCVVMAHILIKGKSAFVSLANDCAIACSADAPTCLCCCSRSPTAMHPRTAAACQHQTIIQCVLLRWQVQVAKLTVTRQGHADTSLRSCCIHWTKSQCAPCSLVALRCMGTRIAWTAAIRDHPATTFSSSSSSTLLRSALLPFSASWIVATGSVLPTLHKPTIVMVLHQCASACCPSATASSILWPDEA